jgi:uncharacterized protein (DUF433 family)
VLVARNHSSSHSRTNRNSRRPPMAALSPAKVPARGGKLPPVGNRDRKRYNSVMAWQDRISVIPAVRSGKPCIKGTRITVYDVLEYLAGGMTEDAILSDFPDLTRDDIRAALAFAAARERRLANWVA